MAAAEIRTDNVCLTLESEKGRGRVVLRPSNGEECDLPCTLANLSAVLQGIRYHVSGAGMTVSLEKVENIIRLTVRRDGAVNFYSIPIRDLDRALRQVGQAGISVYLA